MIRKAVVLAAGLGTRLRPFTCATPKPLMPVWGETMLARAVNLLRERGVDDIVVNSHHLADQVRDWVDACRREAQAAGETLNIRVSHEPEILGNGGVLNPLRDWIGDDCFYLVSSDFVLENVPDLEAAFARCPSPEVLGCCLAIDRGPRTIEVEPESGFVTCWKSIDPGVDGTYTYVGFSILKPAILDYVEPEGFSSIITAYEKAMTDGKFMRVVTAGDLLWEDAGTIQRYIDLNRDGDDNAFADIPQLKATGAKDFRFLSARGSERVFFSCDKGVAILYDDGARTENGLYAEQARWLKAHGAPVPEVVVDLPDLKTMVMADAGAERKMSLEDYVKVVEALAAFNALGAEPDLPRLMPAFDRETWNWEHGLFARHCLGTRYRMELPKEVAAELGNVASLLEREPKALVHRDFQSTNVLWKDGRFAFIDFQGMRLGPAAYDLASLVYDPYVTFAEGERRALVSLYAKASGRPDIPNILPYAAVQRLVQCLGAFGRLASVGQPQFLKHVVSALGNLHEAAEKAGLDATARLAHDLLHREGHCSCHHH